MLLWIFHSSTSTCTMPGQYFQIHNLETVVETVGDSCSVFMGRKCWLWVYGRMKCRKRFIFKFTWLSVDMAWHWCVPLCFRYRKVVSNECEGGVNKQQSAKQHTCPLLPPRGLQVGIKGQMLAVEPGDDITFIVHQEQVASTWLGCGNGTTLYHLGPKWLVINWIVDWQKINRLYHFTHSSSRNTKHLQLFFTFLYLYCFKIKILCVHVRRLVIKICHYF